jgi:hypothetical protein
VLAAGINLALVSGIVAWGGEKGTGKMNTNQKQSRRKYWTVECRQCGHVAPAKAEGGCPFCGHWDQVEVGQMTVGQMHAINYGPALEVLR